MRNIRGMLVSGNDTKERDAWMWIPVRIWALIALCLFGVVTLFQTDNERYGALKICASGEGLAVSDQSSEEEAKAQVKYAPQIANAKLAFDCKEIAGSGSEHIAGLRCLKRDGGILPQEAAFVGKGASEDEAFTAAHKMVRKDKAFAKGAVCTLVIDFKADDKKPPEWRHI